MYKVREQFVGILIKQGNREYTLYNSLSQPYLEYMMKVLGDKFIKFEQPKLEKPVEDSQQPVIKKKNKSKKSK